MKKVLFAGFLSLTLIVTSMGVLAEESSLGTSSAVTDTASTNSSTVTSTETAATSEAAVTTGTATETAVTTAAVTTDAAATADTTTAASVTTDAAASTTVAITPAGIDTNDPLYISLKEKYQKLIALREIEANLLKSIKEQSKLNNECNKNYEKTLRSKVKNIKGNGKDKNKDKIKAAGDKLNLLIKQRESLKNGHKTENAIKGKGKSVKEDAADEAVNQQTDKLEIEIKARQDEIKDLEESSENEATPETSILEAAKKGSEQVRSIKKETLKLNTEINKLQALLNKEWAAFSKSLKTKDLKAANANMDNILNYKQQIIDKLTGMLDLKKQINGVLSGSGDQNTSGDTTNTTGTTTDTTNTTGTTTDTTNTTGTATDTTNTTGTTTDTTNTTGTATDTGTTSTNTAGE